MGQEKEVGFEFMRGWFLCALCLEKMRKQPILGLRRFVYEESCSMSFRMRCPNTIGKEISNTSSIQSSFILEEATRIINTDSKTEKDTKKETKPNKETQHDKRRSVQPAESNFRFPINPAVILLPWIDLNKSCYLRRHYDSLSHYGDNELLLQFLLRSSSLRDIKPKYQWNY